MWFGDGNRFAFVPLRDLAAEVNSGKPRLRLPSFQRDAVWDEKHVEVLWDSILRGFPIGALLVAQRPDRVSTRRLQRARADHARPTEDVEADLVLIDGQQRATSIAMGFRVWRPGDPCRLWIDLSRPPAQEGMRTRLLLCSLLHPWARDATDVQRRDAIASLNPPAMPADDAVLGTTWPLRAIAPVPMAEFIESVARDDREAWKHLLPAARREKALNDPEVGAFVEEVLAAVVRTNTYQVPVLLLDELGSVEDLGTAFQRLNRQGVEMSAEDLFFSGLKLQWPGAHDLVWDVYHDPQAGQFLAPTKIVHAATRLATNLRMDEPRDVVRLTLEAFRRLVESPEQQTSRDVFLTGIRHHLEPGPGPGFSGGTGDRHGAEQVIGMAWNR